MKCEHCENEISKIGKFEQNTGGLFDFVINTPITMAYTCKYCEGSFCEEHRLPENHNCIGLELWKIQRQKQIFKSQPNRRVDNTRWWEK